MRKGIDRTFMHYGVRQDDLEIIEQACRDEGIDTDWMREQILKPYNEERNKQSSVEEKIITKLIKRALKNLPE